MIYRVELTTEAYVMADSPGEAAKFARRKWADSIDGLTIDVEFVNEAKSLEDVSSDWHNSLPFAEDGANPEERTIRWILEDK